MPHVLEHPDAIRDAAARIAEGAGPIAVDTERASGFRYDDRARLIQIRRRGAGTFLIDPIPHPEALTPLAESLGSAEWILHAADQDLPCLADLGLRPPAVFDTELAARLIGLPRVNLASVVETYLGVTLVKNHGASDWSRRPLPDSWLRYATLDVEYLPELRDALDEDLTELGRREWAQEEFAALMRTPPRAPRPDPWRRVSRINTVRGRRGMAAVRELWRTRDAIARRRDISPGRILPDSGIVAAAQAMPRTTEELLRLPDFRGPRRGRGAELWVAAVGRALDLDDRDLPPMTRRSDEPPPASQWARRDPEAADRLAACREAIEVVADRLGIGVETVLKPATLRRLCWGRGGLLDEVDDAPDAASVDRFLATHGARDWQRRLLAAPLAASLASTIGDNRCATEETGSS